MREGESNHPGTKIGITAEAQITAGSIETETSIPGGK